MCRAGSVLGYRTERVSVLRLDDARHRDWCCGAILAWIQRWANALNVYENLWRPPHATCYGHRGRAATR